MWRRFMLHRNSQKRIYGKNKIYAIPLVTKKRLPFFKEKIFCQLFFNIIKVCRKFYEFELFGIVILFDHVHLLVKPISCNISILIGFIKRHFSKEINIIIENNFEKKYKNNLLIINRKGRFKGLNPDQKEAIKWLEKKTIDYQLIYEKKYKKRFHPKFKWQGGFRDHIIRDQNDFINQLNYIRKNPVKHKLCKSEEDWPWLYYCD